MPSTELKEYQKTLKNLLKRIFPRTPVKLEWATMVNEANVYSPRVDVAVGPFAIRKKYIKKYDNLMDAARPLIQTILSIHEENIKSLDPAAYAPTFDELKFKNPNARCFLAIEIENEVSRKHLMGGAINAAALGRIGLAVAWTPDKLRAFVKLRRYLQFLGSVGKNTFDTTNLLILDRDQLLRSVQSHAGDKSAQAP